MLRMRLDFLGFKISVGANVPERVNFINIVILSCGRIAMLSFGLMSGTSMDAIDVACLETDGEDYIVELGHAKLDYSAETKWLLKAAERAIKAAEGDLRAAALHYPNMLQEYLTQELKIEQKAAAKELARLTTYLQAENKTDNPLSLEAVIQLSTRLHAQVVKKLLLQIGKQPRETDVIGYHGQTMFHNPAKKITVQIGDGQYLAELTRIVVVNDFRGCDVAAGGQGAPFAPIYHQALAKRDGKIPLAVVNCGGIANISLIVGDALDNLIGFDTGPGNGLIDALIRERTFGRETMDRDGQYGLAGKVNEVVLQGLFNTAIRKNGRNYFQMPVPKSLDIRDMTLIPALAELSLADACATLEAFTAEMIVQSLELVNLSSDQVPRHWILAGGGCYNPVIRRELEQRLYAKFGADATIQVADEAGWNSEAMEAQIFAYFAVRSLKNLPLSLPNTTGVAKPLSGGHVYIPSTGGTAAVERLL